MPGGCTRLVTGWLGDRRCAAGRQAFVSLCSASTAPGEPRTSSAPGRLPSDWACAPADLDLEAGCPKVLGKGGNERIKRDQNPVSDPVLGA